MYSKSAIAVFLLLVAFAAYVPSQAYSFSNYAKAPNNSHNLIAGYSRLGDRVAVHFINQPASWWQMTTIEKIFFAPYYERITKVEALDQVTNGTGAYPTIVKNGPGMSNVTLKFTGQMNYGIKFIVKIFSSRP